MLITIPTVPIKPPTTQTENVCALILVKRFNMLKPMVKIIAVIWCRTWHYFKNTGNKFLLPPSNFAANTDYSTNTNFLKLLLKMNAIIVIHCHNVKKRMLFLVTWSCSIFVYQSAYNRASTVCKSIVKWNDQGNLSMAGMTKRLTVISHAYSKTIKNSIGNKLSFKFKKLKPIM